MTFHWREQRHVSSNISVNELEKSFYFFLWADCSLNKFNNLSFLITIVDSKFRVLRLWWKFISISTCQITSTAFTDSSPSARSEKTSSDWWMPKNILLKKSEIILIDQKTPAIVIKNMLPSGCQDQNKKQTLLVSKPVARNFPELCSLPYQC